jgi:regulator of RNase E activity RraA
MSATSDAPLTEYRQIGTSTWSDALDEIGVEGVVGGLVRRSGTGRFAGFAVTAKARAGQLGSFKREAFAVGRMIDAVGPGQVLVIDVSGAEISTFGGLASLAAKINGVAAVVIEGACRDAEEIRETGLWLASRHVTPRSGKKRIEVETIGQPVSVSGVSVAPGDLLVGDETGIVVIPRRHLEEAFAAARRMISMDQEIERAIRAGTSFREAARKVNYI